MCYMNSYRLATSNLELTYVEGYVDVGPLVIEHAWCIDKTGLVVETTLSLPKPNAVVGTFGYFGIPFKQEYVWKTAVKTGEYGILTYTNRDLITGKDKPEDFLA